MKNVRIHSVLPYGNDDHSMHMRKLLDLVTDLEAKGWNENRMEILVSPVFTVKEGCFVRIELNKHKAIERNFRLALKTLRGFLGL